MACNVKRTRCSTNRKCPPSSVFSAIASPGCSQFANPEVQQAEQLIYDAAFRDSINNFGVPVEYYINTFNLSAADTLYGEQPTSIFYGPMVVMMYVELAENAINLSKFGFASDDQLTGYVHIKTFNNALSSKDFFIQMSNGDILQYSDYIAFATPENNINLLTGLFQNIVTEDSCDEFLTAIGNDYKVLNKYLLNSYVVEPKAGDLVQLSPLGCDRPNGRGAKVFEITERMDQDVSAINPMLGHYVYRLRAKRFEYSFEPNAPTEPVNDQIYESVISGKVSSDITFYNELTPPKVYEDNIDDTSKQDVLDMSVNNTDIYGAYYQTPYVYTLPTITTVDFVDNDSDGYSNSYEIANGTSPNNPLSFPGSLFNIFHLL
jgi:hypothetical protein